MEKLESYRQIVKDYLSARVRPPKREPVETYTVFDKEQDRYLLMNVGWFQEFNRSYGVIIHIDIKNEKLWIEWNGTEDEIGDELVELGVEKSDIVLAFHAPYKRQYTGFAVE
ncbi:MAG: XisI protein [Chloroflexota bacterium]